jgi:hypothetical protein
LPIVLWESSSVTDLLGHNKGLRTLKTRSSVLLHQSFRNALNILKALRLLAIMPNNYSDGLTLICLSPRTLLGGQSVSSR